MQRIKHGVVPTRSFPVAIEINEVLQRIIVIVNPTGFFLHQRYFFVHNGVSVLIEDRRKYVLFPQQLLHSHMHKGNVANVTSLVYSCVSVKMLVLDSGLCA
jgi:hypothetical protein